MATSPSPLKFLPTPSSYPSSHPHFLLNFQPQSVSASSFRALRLKISCSSQTIEIGTQENSPTKKKRKPRPSFLDQIQEKWSRKTTSSRELFPWEEEEREKFETIEENCLQSAGAETDSEKSSAVSDSSSFSSIKKVNLPPWAHGNKQRTSQFVSEARDLDKSNDEGESLNGNDAAVHLEKLGDGVDFDDKIGERGVKDDDARVGPSQNGQTLVLKLDKGDEYNDNATGMFQEFSNVKGLSEARRLPWQRENEGESIDGKRLRSNADLAEKVIPEPELKRLRNMAVRMVERIKVGAAGVTQTLVDNIHEKWKVDEVVKLKFEGPPAMNMRRTHEILEIRTGGLVIWRSGSSIVLYRGMAYKLECVQSYSKENEKKATAFESSGALANGVNQSTGVKDVSGAAESLRTDSLKHVKNLSSKEEEDLQELNFSLDELGPRFKDWSGPEPLPVDADLLPAVVSGYKSPFRLLPHGIRLALQDKEMTYFRRTARQMPPHFALGRNRELQGLAMAMVKLWERSAIAKIAIKRGVQNTWNERMAEELKVKDK